MYCEYCDEVMIREYVTVYTHCNVGSTQIPIEVEGVVQYRCKCCDDTSRPARGDMQVMQKVYETISSWACKNVPQTNCEVCGKLLQEVTAKEIFTFDSGAGDLTTAADVPKLKCGTCNISHYTDRAELARTKAKLAAVTDLLKMIKHERPTT